VIHLKSPEEIEAMARAGAIIGALFREVPGQVDAGVSTGQLDRFAEDFIRSFDGAVPAFQGLYGFPGAVCISVNEEVVHGIPRPDRQLKKGDIVTLDVGVKLNGWCGDSAWTFPVGKVDGDTARLLRVTEDALDAAVEAAVPGNHVGDIGAAVEARVKGTGFGIIRDLVGHGIGRSVHEDPQVPNYGKPGSGELLEVGAVLAIEPMLAAGTWQIRTLADRWTVISADRTMTAHFEHTVAVTEEGPRILTAAPSEVTSPA
jgi:methionyl aminopeptidase